MENIVIDDTHYKSYLSKNALAYNLSYHLSQMTSEDNPFEIIYSILDKMEEKPNKNS